MPKRQRSDEFLLEDLEPDLHIVVHGNPEPLKAHYDVVKLYSKCVLDLPRNSDGSPTVWDVSGLMLEGESTPFDSAVVEQWLDLVYSHVDPTRQIEPPRTLGDAKPLLLFADAVSSGRIIFAALARMLVSSESLCLHLDVGELHLDLALRGNLFMLSQTLGLAENGVPFGGSRRQLVPVGDLTGPQVQQISAAACVALEEWLYLAGRLRMVPLVRLLLDFIKLQLVAGGPSILLYEQSSVLTRIYSPRVLQCMPPELLLEGFVRDSFTNLPSTVNLRAESVSMVLESPAAASFMNLAPGSELVAEATVKSSGSTIVKDSRGYAARLNATLGGLAQSQAAHILKEILSAFKKAG